MPLVKPFYICEPKRYKKLHIDKLNYCEVLSILRLYHGAMFSEEDIKAHWVHGPIYPSRPTIVNGITVKNLKWYINTHTAELVKYPEWNPDFLMGMLQWGEVLYSRYNFPSCRWYGNVELFIALNCCPYAGKKNGDKWKPGDRFIWSIVPALCFSYSSESIEYMAGVLSVGLTETIRDKGVLVQYNNRVGKLIRQWNIPIEHSTKKAVYISPFWPILLQDYMPDVLSKRWKIIHNPPYKAGEYSSIMWKVYTGKDPVVGKMPFLLSRRTIFYRYGSLRALKDMWVKNHLVELDSRFKKVVQHWQAKTV
jgi:hypothetical protein